MIHSPPRRMPSVLMVRRWSQHLETVDIGEAGGSAASLRMPVQSVTVRDDFRGYAGTAARGGLRPATAVVFCRRRSGNSQPA